MSTDASVIGRGSAPARLAVGRPGWWRLVWSAAAGMVRATIVLYLASVLLVIAGAAPIDVQDVYSPWTGDTPGGAVAAVGWAVFVIALMTPYVAGALDEGLGVHVSRGWIATCLAAAGYGADVAFSAQDDRAAVVVAVLLMALLVRWVVLQPDGAARPLAFEHAGSSRRARLVAALAGLAVAVGYGATHPLTTSGAGTADGISPELEVDVLSKPTSRVAVGLDVGSWLPIRVLGATPILEGGGLRVTETAVRRDSEYLGLPKPRPVQRLPLRVGSRQNFSVAFALRQAPCDVGSGALVAVRLRYRVAGTVATQRVGLDRPVVRRCR